MCHASLLEYQGRGLGGCKVSPATCSVDAAVVERSSQGAVSQTKQGDLLLYHDGILVKI